MMDYSKLINSIHLLDKDTDPKWGKNELFDDA